MGKKYTLNVNGVEVGKDGLKSRFDEYNKLYFDGKLGKCNFFWLCTKASFGKYRFKRTEKGIESYIGVARDAAWTEDTLKELLIHEMIHMYVTTIDGKPYDGLLGHGRLFRKHCKRLKDEYNLIINVHTDYGGIRKGPSPKLWEKVLLWLIDR